MIDYANETHIRCNIILLQDNFYGFYNIKSGL